MSIFLRRREFIAGLGSAAAAWPLAAKAQQGTRVRRIGVLTGAGENDEKSVAAFAQRLADLGWTVGRNVQVDVRFFAGNIDRMRTSAKELIDSQPDLILTNTTPSTAILQRETRVIPIVFMAVSDPVGSGFVASLPRPGGNITGFIDTEASMAGKWLELLSEIAPGLKRAAIMFNPDTAPGGGSYFLTSFEAAARSFKMEPMIARVHSEAEIETVMNSLGRKPLGGLVVMPDAYMHAHGALQLYCRQPETKCQQSLTLRAFLEPAVCFPTELTWEICGFAPPLMSIAFCAARNRRSCPFSFRQNSRWS